MAGHLHGLETGLQNAEARSVYLIRSPRDLFLRWGLRILG